MRERGGGFEGGLEGVECGGDLVVDALAVGGEVFGGGGDGGKGFVVRGGGEGQVELGGALAEEGGGFEVGAGVLLDVVRSGEVEISEKKRSRSARVQAQPSPRLGTKAWRKARVVESVVRWRSPR